MIIKERKRADIEQHLSCEPEIYSVEDEMFLYYREGDTLHVAKGNSDWSMDVSEWDVFLNEIGNVSDEHFVTGKGKELKDCFGFLGGYLSKYTRRKQFLSCIRDIIDDSEAWCGNK